MKVYFTSSVALVQPRVHFTEHPSLFSDFDTQLSIIINNNITNLTKSVRELAANINAPAPDSYDSNDEVSEKCLSVEAEFEAAGVLCHEGEGATDGREDVAFPLATSGQRLG